MTGSATVTISQKMVSLIWGKTSFIYDGAEKLPTATADGLIDGDACTVTVTGAQTAPGTYVAIAESLSNDNYQLPEETAVSFTIAEGTIEAVAEGYDGVYDGESHSIAVTAPDGASVTYSESADGEYNPDNPAYRNAGSYTVYYKVTLSGFSTVQGSEAVRIAKREVTVSGIRAGDKLWDSNTDAALIFSDVAFDGLLDGDTLAVSVTGEFEDAEIGNGKTVTITNLTLGGTDAGNYRLAENGQQESTKANITPNPLNVSPVGYSGVYDGEFHGVTVEAPDGASVAYSESEDGEYFAVSPEYADAGHYAVFYKVEAEGSETVAGSVAVNIERKGIRVAGIAAENKPYDGNTNATLNYDNVTFDGIITGDELTIAATGTFEDAEVGDGKTVTIADLTLGGFSAGNYRLSKTVQQETATADIIALTLDVSAADWSGTYDGELHSVTVIAPDGVSVTYSESENGAYSAENPTYTNAGSYTVYYKAAQVGADNVTGSATVTISEKPVTVSGITANDKPYDGNTDATLNYDNVTFDGIITGDELTVTATGTFESAEVGDGKSVTITDLTLDGADAGNYQLAETGQQTETTANITANSLNVTAIGYSGTYDGEPHSVTVTAPDDVSVTYSESESGAYSAENPVYRNAGSYTVYYKAAKVGADTVTGSVTITIGKKPVAVSGITATDKPYDANTNATLNYDNITFHGIVTGDELTATATGTFESAEVGDGKTVRITNLTLGGADAENYRLADSGQQTETTANITANALNVTATGYSGTYDGNPHSITVTAPEGAAVTYSESEDGPFSSENPGYTNSGEYAVWYRVSADDAESVSGYAVVNIGRAVARVRLKLADRSDCSRAMTSWPYGGTPAVPLLTVERDERTANVMGVAVLMADDAQDARTTFTEYGQVSYSYSLRGDSVYQPISSEELSVLPAGAYTMRVDVAATRNLPAGSATADFTITKAEHSDVVAPPVGTIAGARSLRLNLNPWIEEGASCAVSSFSGGLLDGTPFAAGNELHFDTADDVAKDANLLSASVRVTVSSRNYEDYALTIPLTAGGSLTLRFDGNGAASPASRTLRPGVPLGELPAPERAGYRFDGWSAAKDGGEIITAESVMGDMDMTLYARWTALRGAVTLLLDGGSLDAENWTDAEDRRTRVFQSDSEAFLLPEPVREGYTFTGWTEETDEAANRNEKPSIRVMIPQGSARDYVYRANWALGSRTGEIGFTKGGVESPILGILSLPQDAEQVDTQRSGAEGDHATAVALKELAGDDETETLDGQTKNVSVRMNVYVQPSLANRRTEELDEAGRTAKAEQEQLFNAATAAFDGDDTMTADFFSIDIEKTVAVTGGADGENSDPESTRLNETSRILEIPIRYDLSGRYIPMVSRYHDGARTFVRLPERPEAYQDTDALDGHFYVSGAGSDAVIYVYSNRFSTYNVATSGEEAYAVLFQTDGGTEIEPQTVRVKDGGKAKQPPDPKKDGFTFGGWYSAPKDAGEAFDFDATPIRADTTLYARWRANEAPESSDSEPSPQPQISPVGANAPELREYVVANGYRGTYDGESHGIHVETVTMDAEISYSQWRDGPYEPEPLLYRNAGTYRVYYQAESRDFTIRNYETVTILPKSVTVSGITAENKLYDGKRDATLNYDRVEIHGLVYGDRLTVSAAGEFSTAEPGKNKVVAISNLALSGEGAENYALAKQGNQTRTTADILENTLNVQADGWTGTYDGKPHSVTVTASPGVSIAYRTDDENGAGTADSPYSENNPAFTDAGRYLVHYYVQKDGASFEGSAAVEILTRSVTVSGIRARDKRWDGNALAELLYDSVALDGKIDGDSLSVTAFGAFENPDIGDMKAVRISGLVLNGESAKNYRLAEAGQQAVATASILPRESGVRAEGWNGIYDGQPHSIALTVPEGLTAEYRTEADGAYSTENPSFRDAGAHTVEYRVSGNGIETVTGSAEVRIAKRPVIVSGITAADKPYDGTSDAVLLYGGVTFDGALPGDELTVTAEGAFSDPNPGERKAVHITLLALGGSGAGNYVLAETAQRTEAGIAPNPLDVRANGWTGTYDGAFHSAAVHAPEGAAVEYADSPSGPFGRDNPAYRNAGTYAVHYRVTREGSPVVTGVAEVRIEKRPVTVSGIRALDKLWDGTRPAELDCSGAAFRGKLDGDTLSVTAEGAFADAEEGRNKPVRLTGLALGGPDAGNYRLAEYGQQSEARADIIRKTYTITGSLTHEKGGTEDSDDGAIQMELRRDGNVSASVAASLSEGGKWEFRKVYAGDYAVVATRKSGGQTVTLTMPIRVGDG